MVSFLLPFESNNTNVTSRLLLMWHPRRDFISFRKLCLLSRSRIVILILIHRDYSLAYGKCTLAILHYAVPECKVKVKSRPYKIMGEVSRFLESSFDGKVHYEPTESFSELVRSSLGQSMPEDMLMDEFLEGVLSCARGVSLKKRNL